MIADHMGFASIPNIRTIQEIAVATAAIDYRSGPDHRREPWRHADSAGKRSSTASRSSRRRSTG